MRHLVYMVGVGCADTHARDAQLQTARHMAVSDTVE